MLENKCFITEQQNLDSFCVLTLEQNGVKNSGNNNNTTKTNKNISFTSYSNRSTVLSATTGNNTKWNKAEIC